MAANNYASYIREIWAPEVQELAKKQLIAMSITKQVPMPDGDTFHRPFSSRVGTGSYTRNASSNGVTPTAITTTDEYLSVDTAKYASFEIDRLDARQTMYALEGDLKDDAIYQLRNLIDASILAEYANAASVVDGGDITGGTDGQAILLTTSNLLDVIEAAKVKLAQQDVENNGDWFVVVDEVNYYKVVEKLMATSGYKNQDNTLKNGFMGTILDVEFYMSRNLSTSVVSNHNTKHWLMGRKGAISFAMQEDIHMEEKDLPQNTDGTVRLSTMYILWNLYGKKTFTDGARKLVDIQVRY
jgi:hypothetical protein